MAEDYFGSKKYAEDIKALVKRFPTKAIWGGITSNGYTKITTITGEKVSIPVGTKER